MSLLSASAHEKWSGVDLNHRHTDFQSVAPRTQEMPQPLSEERVTTEAENGEGRIGVEIGEDQGAASQEDPELANLVERWPNLPERVRQAILLLVK